MTRHQAELLALMRDQLKKLNELGIPARCINSEQENAENEAVIKEAKDGKLKLLYIAPERQENDQWIDATRSMNLKMVVIDEAHCISVWGHDFRPAFRRIINLVKLLPAGFPVLATTATATKRVEQDIVRQMGGNTVSIRGKLVRPNFHLRVVKVKSEEEKMIWLGKNLDKLPGTGVIYTGTRVNTEVYSHWLEFQIVKATNLTRTQVRTIKADLIEQGIINEVRSRTAKEYEYEHGGDFPDFLIILTLKAFRKHYGKTKFDLVVYVPPTESGNLVKNFASKIASTLGVPISHNLRKVIATKPQKVFQNGLLKADNVAGAFEFEPELEAVGKSILLIDDIYDSGATVKEIGKLFTKLSAKTIAPLVIAKTVGGDLSV